mmetsp:Transcript_28056/g.67594  ORF Transcript_28056/g.67594 Transcript_28056/m.67594 type:complete len:279 (-) Transcript_28056:47-883(-)
MTRRLLVSTAIALSGCTNSVVSFSGVKPTVKSAPWLNIRGSDGSLTVRPTTSLKSTVLGAVDTFYKTMPLASAFMTCGVKASLADIVAQKRAAKEVAQTAQTDDYENDTLILGEIDSAPFEKRRNLAFFLYGGLYQGMAQEIIFNEAFPIIFGQGTDLQTVFSKVLFDSLVITPLLCLPVAYFVKSVIFQYSFKEAINRYTDDVLKNGLLVKYWSLWSPVQCLTFGVVPQHLRIAWIAFVSFFWLIIFSSISAKGQKERELLDDSCSLEDGVSCRIDG